MTSLLVLFLLVASGFLWADSTRARERATSHARRLCKQAGVQFLDQTVSLAKIRPSRSRSGNACLRRIYHFEYTTHGDFRDSGVVVMNGQDLVSADIPYTRDLSGNRTYEQ